MTFIYLNPDLCCNGREIYVLKFLSTQNYSKININAYVIV